MTRFKNAELSASTKVQIQDLFSITLPMINRMTVEGKSKATIKSYARAVDRLVRFHDFTNPRDLDLDEVMDFLVDLTQRSKVNWRTNKMYVAGLRYYWSEMLEDQEFASRIPYPKEHPSLPKILSRQELTLLFDACANDKHRVMFRLIYSSGLRRRDLINLRLSDLETKDGKCRLRINKGKGSKDRYTVLSKNALIELRAYYKKYKPKVFLFNGRKKGMRFSEAAIRQALEGARKRSGIKRKVTLHVLRHCFATHALEHGMTCIRWTETGFRIYWQIHPSILHI